MTSNISNVTAQSSEFSVKRHIVLALGLCVGMVVGIGGWAATAELGGAVVAPGSFVVDRKVKKVQHSFGGVVAEIAVRNGIRVSAGDIIVRLDPTQVKAELGIINSQRVETTARMARLIAERDGALVVAFPEGFAPSSREAAEAASSEQRLFAEARKARESQKEQLRYKIRQINEEIQGLTAQRDAKKSELSVSEVELGNLRGLNSKQLVTAGRLNAVERDVMRLKGDHASLIAQIARAKGQISEVETQILGLDETMRTNAQRELRVAEAKLVELSEREIAAKDKLMRVDVRAPASGLVHELAVHTIGGVISQGEQLMLIVPDDEKLVISAKIQNSDRDKAFVGQSVRLRLTAFAHEKTPEVDGRIIEITADVSTESKGAPPFYGVRIELDDKARETVKSLKLQPGMPVEAFISTGDRTVMSYLMKPLVDQMKRAWRE
jgi:HlyD family secretion protein